MNGGIHLILVDGDVRRRARISHGLSDRGLHVEPFEDIAELIAHWPGAGLILVHDDDGTIDRLVAHMGQSGQWLPAVAFADAPTARRVAQAVHAGVLGMEVDGLRTILRPGDRLEVPAGAVRQSWNEGNGPLELTIEVAPFGGIEALLEALVEMTGPGVRRRAEAARRLVGAYGDEWVLRPRRRNVALAVGALLLAAFAARSFHRRRAR